MFLKPERRHTPLSDHDASDNDRAGMTEFELIRAYFASQPVARSDVRVGIGDDAALVRPPAGMELAMATDVLVAGIHFFEDADPASIGYKALAVNLSDLAAMGAEPAWFLLDLTLPRADAAWLRGFADGLYELARRYDVQLIGGDTSRGPLSIAVTVVGFVPPGQGLLRAGARAGDLIYVTGTLGDAALALGIRRGQHRVADAEYAAIRQRLDRPVPRIAEGIALRGFASSAIDVSDGLLADLGHVLEASGVGARLALDAVPLSPVYRAHVSEIGWDYALAGGDDYELCITVPPGRRGEIEALARERQFSLWAIGEVTSTGGLRVHDAAGRLYRSEPAGHDHFRSA